MQTTIKEYIIREWRDDLGIVHRDEVSQIVRCKNCIYYNGDEAYCDCDHFAKENGYCFYGDEGDDK